MPIKNRSCTKTNYDLLCFGEVLWDRYTDAVTPGGAALNVAVNAHLLGVNTVLISALGTDADGFKLEQAIHAYGMHTHLQRNRYPTGTVDVTLNKQGVPSFYIRDNTAYDHVIYNAEVKKLCTQSKFICFGTLGQRNAVSRNTLRKIVKYCGAVRIYDVNARESIPGMHTIIKESLEFTDILKINQDEMDLLHKLIAPDRTENEFISYLINEYSLTSIYITMGSRGASVYTRKGVFFHTAAPRIKVVDTTGCGDAFTASIIHSAVHEFNYKKTLENAVIISAKTAKIKGALPDKS